MRYFFTLIAITFLIQGANAQSSAQRGLRKISGVVMDSTTKSPVEFANVALLDPSSGKMPVIPDSRKISGFLEIIISRKNGQFNSLPFSRERIITCKGIEQIPSAPVLPLKRIFGTRLGPLAWGSIMLSHHLTKFIPN
ncbi:hypothetical protein BH10BAC4_BH10BAC4_25080 [soil metagenome]